MSKVRRKIGFVGGKGASFGNSKSAMSLGKQLNGKIFNFGNVSRGFSYYGKELSKAFKYYGKNMMNAAGKSIYRELKHALVHSGLTVLGINSAKSAYLRYGQ